MYLVVDAENEAAWNLYERSGFMHAATKEEGPIGKERLYYLDLDAKFVSSLRLKPNTQEDDHGIYIVDLLKDDEKVGFLALELHTSRINIAAIEVDEEMRQSGIAQSALRQVATYVRKHFKDVNVITITLYGAHDELRAMCTHSNFVETSATEHYVMFEKYINY